MLQVLFRFTIIVVAVVTSTQVASAQRDAYQAEGEIERLLNDARRSYDNLELQQAETSVDRALQLVAQFGAQSGTAARLVARVYILRGIIAYVRDRNTSAAASDFAKALQYDDRVTIDQMMSTPSLERVFEQARGQVRTRRDVRRRQEVRREDRYDRRDDDFDRRNDAGRPERYERRDSEIEPEQPPLSHQRPRTARNRRTLDLTIRVSKRLDRDVDSVFLYFRTARSQSTQRLEMRRGRGYTFTARIPRTYMVGNTVSYYFKAENRDRRAIANLGNPREPFRVPIKGDTIGADSFDVGSSLDGSAGRKTSRTYVSTGVSLGTGFGQITEYAKPVKQPGARISEPGLALSPLHLLFELDVLATEWMSVGVYGRIQIIEFTHLFGGRFKFRVHNDGNHALYARVGGGVGTVRHLVQLNGGKLDTTLEGKGSVTMGLGYGYTLAPGIQLMLTPDFIWLFGDSASYHLDLNIGVVFSF
ncbi:MAG: hypothetical protein VX589_19905 [Myxococcota bacterium]|nr:hypothetical protein [Myxococcota bacterium]